MTVTVAQAKLPFEGPYACERHDPELWFPVSKADGSAEVGKSICRECPVRVECLAYSLTQNVRGTWGGEDEWTRDRMRRNLGRTSFRGGRPRAVAS